MSLLMAVTIAAALPAAAPSVCSIPTAPALFRTGLPLMVTEVPAQPTWPATMVAAVALDGAPAGETLAGLADAIGVRLEWMVDDAYRARPLSVTLGDGLSEITAEQALRKAAGAVGLRPEPVAGEPGLVHIVADTAPLRSAQSVAALSLASLDAAAGPDIAAMSAAIESGAAAMIDPGARAVTGGLVLDAVFITVRATSGRLDLAGAAAAGSLVAAGMDATGSAVIIREASNGATERWLDGASDWRVISRQRLGVPYGFRVTGEAAACGEVASPAGISGMFDVAQVHASRAGVGLVRIRARVGYDEPAKLIAGPPMLAKPGDRLLVLAGEPRGGWQSGILAVVRIAEASPTR